MTIRYDVVVVYYYYFQFDRNEVSHDEQLELNLRYSYQILMVNGQIESNKDRKNIGYFYEPFRKKRKKKKQNLNETITRFSNT